MLVAPAGMPSSKLNTLNAALVKALGSADVQRQFVEQGAFPAKTMKPDEFWAFVDIVTTRMSLLRSLKVGLHECQPIPWTDGTDLTFSNGSLEELSFTNGSLLSPAGNSFWQSIPTNTVKDLTLCNLHGVPDSIARIISQAFTTLRSLTVSLDSDNLDRQFGGLHAVTGCLVGLEHVFPKPSF